MDTQDTIAKLLIQNYRVGQPKSKFAEYYANHTAQDILAGEYEIGHILQLAYPYPTSPVYTTEQMVQLIEGAMNDDNG